jgi:DNA mismatch repair ATPase MutS
LYHIFVFFSHHFEALWNCTESGRDHLIYTHKLLPGVTEVENYGLHLAQGLACPESVLTHAKDLTRKLSSQRKVNFIITAMSFVNWVFKKFQVTSAWMKDFKVLLSTVSEVFSFAPECPTEQAASFKCVP